MYNCFCGATICFIWKEDGVEVVPPSHAALLQQQQVQQKRELEAALTCNRSKNVQGVHVVYNYRSD